MKEKELIELKIQSMGRVLKRLIILIALLGPAAIALLLYMQNVDALLNLPNTIQIDPASLSLLDWLIVVLLGGVIRPLPFVPLLWWLYRLFSAYANGVVFSTQNTLYIKRCGLMLILIDVFNILHSMVAGPVLSAAGITQGFFIIQIGLSYSIVGLFVYLISRVMEIALSMKQDLDYTI